MFCQFCGSAVDATGHFCTCCGQKTDLETPGRLHSVDQPEPHEPGPAPAPAASIIRTGHTQSARGFGIGYFAGRLLSRAHCPSPHAVGNLAGTLLKRTVIVLSISVIGTAGLIVVTLIAGYKDNETVYDAKGKAVVVSGVPGDATEHIEWVRMEPFSPGEVVPDNLSRTLTPAYPACAQNIESIKKGVLAGTCSMILVLPEGSLQFFHFVERDYPGSPDWTGTAYEAGQIPDLVAWRIGKNYIFDSRVPPPTPASGGASVPLSPLLTSLPLTLEQAEEKFPPKVTILTKDDDNLKVEAGGRLVGDYNSNSADFVSLPNLVTITCSENEMQCLESIAILPATHGEMSGIDVIDGTMQRAPIEANTKSNNGTQTKVTFSVSKWISSGNGYSIEAAWQDQCRSDILSIDTTLSMVKVSEIDSCNTGHPLGSSFVLFNNGQ